MRALDFDGMRTWQAAEKAARAEARRKLEADNWFGMPSAEPHRAQVVRGHLRVPA